MATSKPLSFLNFGSKQENHDVADDAAQEPLFSIVRGNPTEEELAALTAVVVAMNESSQQTDQSAMALWQRRLNRGQRMGVNLRPGPGSWKRARPM